MKKLLISTIFGTIIYFFLGWFIFEFLLGEYFKSNSTQIVGFKKSEQEASLLFLTISCLAYALLLSILMWKWTQIKTFKEGLIFGIVTGMLVATMTNTYWYSTTNFFNGLLPVLVDIIAAGLSVGVMGGVIAWILGYKDKS